MSAFQILISELAQRSTITYADLLRRHGKRYDYTDFTHAVWKARKLGLVTNDKGRGKPIVATGACPCCGRKL